MKKQVKENSAHSGQWSNRFAPWISLSSTKYKNTAQRLTIVHEPIIHEYSLNSTPFLGTTCNYKMNFICKLFCWNLEWTRDVAKTMTKWGGPLPGPECNWDYLSWVKWTSKFYSMRSRPPPIVSSWHPKLFQYHYKHSPEWIHMHWTGIVPSLSCELQDVNYLVACVLFPSHYSNSSCYSTPISTINLWYYVHSHCSLSCELQDT